MAPAATKLQAAAPTATKAHSWVLNTVSKLEKKAATRNKTGSCKAIQY